MPVEQVNVTEPVSAATNSNSGTADNPTFMYNSKTSTMSGWIIANTLGNTDNIYFYNPYGTLQFGTVGSVFGSQGQYRRINAMNSEFIYMSNRYYDPTTSQFVTVDPMLNQTDQAYVYSGDNPVTGWDLSGMSWYNPCSWRNICHHIHNVLDGARHETAHLWDKVWGIFSSCSSNRGTNHVPNSIATTTVPPTTTTTIADSEMALLEQLKLAISGSNVQVESIASALAAKVVENTGLGCNGFQLCSLSQVTNLEIINAVGLVNGLSQSEAMQMVAAVYCESSLNASLVNSIGADSLIQLYSNGYKMIANKLGGVLNPVANTEAILPAYQTYWTNNPNAPSGAGAAVEVSGYHGSWYSAPIATLDQYLPQ
jgi:RHS repeat-associated protein